MAKPNYSFEKRQRELAKKKKQEEKRLRKANRHESASPTPSEDGAVRSTENQENQALKAP